MTNTTVTIEQIRTLTGIDEDLLDDENVQLNISRTTSYTDPFFNIKTTPVKVIDFIEVIDEFAIDVNKNPLLSIKKIKQNNSNIDISTIQFSSSGSIRLDFRRFYNIGLNQRNNMVFIEYIYGWMSEDDEKEMTTEILSLGDDVTITVTDSTNYEVDNWIRIKGFDGNQEVTQIKSLPTATTITVDNLVFNHEEGSMIEKLIKPEIINQYILYESAIACAINSIGGTYTFATSYNIEGLSAVTGVPYPHFEKVYNSLIKQRDILKSRINDSLIRVL